MYFIHKLPHGLQKITTSCSARVCDPAETIRPHMAQSKTFAKQGFGFDLMKYSSCDGTQELSSVVPQAGVEPTTY
jgi:hypothetical protein